MRIIALATLLVLLAGCAGGPQAFGITGPDGGKSGPAAAAPPPSDPFDNPDTLDSGARYGPTYEPTTNGGHFWGYN
jgi:hypothetical protein